MNTIKRIATAATTTMLALAASAIVFGGTAKALPWSSSTTGLDHPGFNVFTGVPGVGDESDFVRGRVSGSSNDFTDPVNDACATGTQFSVRVYVHNAANQSLNNNGSGSGVAHDTKVKVNVPGSTANKITGTISASNAATVSDTFGINCAGGATELSYVNGSAAQQRMDGSTAALSDNIVTTGAKIGTKDVNGDVWGCFEQRVVVYLKVKVAKKVAPKSEGECKVANVEQTGNRTVKVTVDGSTTNAQVVGYKIDFGDGTVVNEQTTSHTYAKDGTYTITTSVQIKFADGHTEWKTADACKKVVSFKNNQPVPTPTELTSTGAGNVVGVFAATSIAGAFLHRRWTLRKASR